MRQEQAGYVPSRHVQAATTNFVALEIDVDAFENENQARMRRGTNGYAPLDVVTFQYASAVFTIGFLHQCQECKHKGPRAEFNKTEDPPWKCPKCKSDRVFRTMESERIDLPEVIANHGYRNSKGYPNKISPDGQVLIEKDNSQAPIRFLRKVSRIDTATGERQNVKRDFACSFCGESFLTLRLLQEHRAAAHGLGGGAVAEVAKPGQPNGVTAAQAVRVIERVIERAPEPAAAAQHETVSGGEPEPDKSEPRKSPAELKAALEKAKGKGAKPGEAE
jgi:hypothetical protein